MIKHKEEVILDYSASKLFELVLDIEKYPEFLPWCKNVKIITKTDEEIIADLTVHYKALTYTYRSKIKHLESKDELEIDIIVTKGIFKNLDNKWRFRDIGESKSMVKFDIKMELNSFFLNHILKFIFHEAYKKMLGAFERRAGEIYQPYN